MSHQTLEVFRIYQKIHIIGIGGIGISAIARILAKEGHHISGSDLAHSRNISLLEQEGIQVIIGQKPENISSTIQLVIYTTAIPADNPELMEARRKNIKTISYPEAVGLLTRNYRTICVAGTHGKTTTTALLALMMEKVGSDPTVIVGSLIKEFGDKNERLGESPWLILESCEYQEAFLNYQPEIVILNNIDPEHLDYFKTPQKYVEAFRKFLNKIPEEGLLIANIDDQNIKTLLAEQNWPFPILTFGQGSAANFRIEANKLNLPDGETIELNLLIPGEHNVYNASAALTAIVALQLDRHLAVQGIETFRGAARRFEIKGKIGNTTIVDDYGHTPVEIRATLEGAKKHFGSNSKLLVIFQPHQYSRTYQFLDQFGASFSKADKVLIPNIYRTRDSEEDVARVDVNDLVKTINSHSITGEKALNTHDFPETCNYVKDHHTDFDAIITIGAGDITKLSEQFTQIVN